MTRPLISASILGADFGELQKEIKMVEAAAADMLHLDIMDGVFVPNITFGCDLIKSIRKLTTIPFDAHLMVKMPEKHIEAFAQAGCDIITIHAEATRHIDRVIESIHACGKKAGLALNPATHENILEYVVERVDYLLIMTVNPGFYGQKFIDSQLPKIARVKKIITDKGLRTLLAVDGGMTPNNAKKCVAAGADIVVAAKAIFGSDDYARAIGELRGGKDIR